MQNTRLVTLLFTDVEGSTRLLASFGNTFLSVIERQRAILTGAASARRGSGYPTGGDGCVFIFGSAGDAVAVAVEAQRALATEPWPDGASVRVRMAIHAGEVVEVGDELFGMALHHVARMLAVTHGGQIIVSDAAAGLIPEPPADISLLGLGVHRLRDIVRPVRLHQAVADGIPTSFPPLTTAKSRPSRLPAATTSFVGRERELRELVDLVASRRLVTLTGAGGSGKTRLALEGARHVEERHRDGVCLVELAGLGTDVLVPDAVLGALGMREPTAGRSATQFLCAALADRAALLVLDNCEHVVAGVAALVSALLPTCPALHVLATSREPLRVPGEVERPVSPLNRPDPNALESPEQLAAYDAVRLLVERGADVRPGFEITDRNAAAVARICCELAGLPLAIELAAARFRTLSPEQVSARLGGQLDLLAHGGRGRPDRQQTMRAALDWSHRLLDAEEQMVFRRLSIFAGGFTLDAAEQVADGEGIERAGVASAVERLASKSLVAVDHDRNEPRLHMLEPVRQYAAEWLNEASERDRVVRRHLEWVVSLAVKAGNGFMREQRRWSARLRDDENNIRQAMERALAGLDPYAALRIVAALGYPWFTMGQPDAYAWVVRALQAATGAPDRIRALALLAAGFLTSNALDYDRALVHLREARDLFQRVGGRRGEAWVLMAMGRAAQDIDVDERPATAWFEDAFRIFREVDDPAGIGALLGLLAEERLKAGDVDGATSRATEAFDVGTRSGLLQVVAFSRWVLGVLAAIRGQHADAERLLEEAAAANTQAGERWQLALILTTAAHVAFVRGDDTRALGLLREALRLARDSGSGERMVYGVELAAHVLHRRGRAPEVATLVGAVEGVNQRLPRRMEMMRALPWPAGRNQPISEGGFEVLASLVSPKHEEHRVSGRGLSLERAADLALRVLDEELALVSPPARSGSEAAGETRPAPAATPSDEPGHAVPNLFHREGDYWSVTFDGATIRLRHTAGVGFLADLLAAPNREVAALVLAGDTGEAGWLGEAAPVLDKEARDAYRARLADLKAERDEAEAAHDSGRTERLDEELAILETELSRAVGLRGRRRYTGSAAERARVNVTKSLRAALRRITAAHSGLGDHLTRTLRTGFSCAYAPDPRAAVAWDVRR